MRDNNMWIWLMWLSYARRIGPYDENEVRVGVGQASAVKRLAAFTPARVPSRANSMATRT